MKRTMLLLLLFVTGNWNKNIWLVGIVLKLNSKKFLILLNIKKNYKRE